jgi:hypothetical protein
MARLIEAYAEERELDIWGLRKHDLSQRGQGARARSGRVLRAIETERSGSRPRHRDRDHRLARAPRQDERLYAGLGVKEVWVWRPNESLVQVHCLNASGGYDARARSLLLPELELATLSQFVRPGGESHTKLVKAYRAAIRSG